MLLVAQSCLTLCNTIDCACQAPLSMGFSGQEYWSELPFPFPGDLPDPGIEPESQVLADRFFTLSHLGSLNETRGNPNFALILATKCFSLYAYLVILHPEMIYISHSLNEKIWEFYFSCCLWISVLYFFYCSLEIILTFPFLYPHG